MNSYKKISAGAVLALSVISVPYLVAYADEGVVTNEFSLKENDGLIIKEFKENDSIQLSSEKKSTYQTEVNGQTYDVKKGNILKTIQHQEKSLSLTEENITLKSSPDLFGTSLLPLDKGEVVQRINEITEQNGFIKVKTKQKVEGWVSKNALNQNIRNIPVKTKAFMTEDSIENTSLTYGKSVSVVGFEENQYVLRVADEEVLVNKEAISFIKPPKRFINPIHISTPRITSLPGWRTDPVYGDRRHHGGTDIAVMKNTPIYATSDGQVIKTHTGETHNNGAGYGNYVKLSHAHDITSLYAHLTSLVVKDGEKVARGQLIGYSGSTGKSTGYHLHFEMEQNGVLMDTSLIINGARNHLQPAPK